MCGSPSHRPDERRLSGTLARKRRADGRRGWPPLVFPVASAGREAFKSLVVCAGVFHRRIGLLGREAFESLVVGVVSRRIGRTRCV